MKKKGWLKWTRNWISSDLKKSFQPSETSSLYLCLWIASMWLWWVKTLDRMRENIFYCWQLRRCVNHAYMSSVRIFIGLKVVEALLYDALEQLTVQWFLICQKSRHQTYEQNGKEGEKKYMYTYSNIFPCFPSSTKDGSGARESLAFRPQGSLLRSRTLACSHVSRQICPGFELRHLVTHRGRTKVGGSLRCPPSFQPNDPPILILFLNVTKIDIPDLGYSWNVRLRRPPVTLRILDVADILITPSRDSSRLLRFHVKNGSRCWHARRRWTETNEFTVCPVVPASAKSVG